MNGTFNITSGSQNRVFEGQQSGKNSCFSELTFFLILKAAML